MTATIIQLRDFQNPKDLARMYGETTLEQQAVGIVDYINGLTQPFTETTGFTEMIPYHGAGIDGMPVSEPGMSGADRFDCAMGVLYPEKEPA